jgi:hypothetical protein
VFLEFRSSQDYNYNVGDLRNSWIHDKGSYDPVQSVKMAKEALAVVSIPKMHVGVLPGNGWRPPEDDIISILTPMVA